MARYWGLRGSKLHLAIWVEACFGVMIFGYNQASAGGVLADVTFNKQFPRMDTLTTTGSLQSYNAKIQGKLSFMLMKYKLTLDRHRRRHVYAFRCVWSSRLHLSR